MKNEINTHDIKKIVDKFNIELLVYFRSYGTEYFNKDSDIDIAFLSRGQLTFDQKLNLMEDLIKLHKKTKIDLVDLRAADPLLRREVAINGRVLYKGKEGLFERYQLYYIKRFYKLNMLLMKS